MVKPGCLDTDMNKVASLRDAQPPKNTTQLKSFLGLRTVYHRSNDDFKAFSYPIDKLLTKGTPEAFPFDDEQRKSFEDLKDKVCSPPFLALSMGNPAYSLDCSLSNYGIGFALFQTHPDDE